MVARSETVRGMKMEMQLAALLAVELDNLMAETKGVCLVVSLAALKETSSVDCLAFERAGDLAGGRAALTAVVTAVA